MNKNNYEFIIAKNGKEAIDILKDNTIPQLILLDLNLPIVDGFEIMEFIRSNPKTQLIPVIILSSSREKKDIQRIYSLGANSYIQKPVKYKTFVEVAKSICNYWINNNENPNFMYRL